MNTKGNKYVIVGGVAGGATFAARMRRLDENAEIIMLERGEHISYANCGLPYYIGGVIKERQKLLLQTPESFKMRYNIEVRIHNEVLSIDTQEKKIKVKDLKSHTEYEETYDHLILSPGAKPIIPPIPNIESKKILYLRDVKDTDAIHNYIQENQVKKAIVIGAGFIGLEMAENLHAKGIETTVVEAAPQVMNMIDPEMAAILHQQFKVQQVGLKLNHAVTHFTETPDNTIEVTLDNGEVLSGDMVLFSIGVKPASELAIKANIATNEQGAIIVNEKMETSAPHVYALGDAATVKHRITGLQHPIFLASPTNKQARILANLLSGHSTENYQGALGTAIAKVFDMTIATTGISEKQAQRHNITYQSATIFSGSHAGYYPGAHPIAIKILFNPQNGHLLGAQAVGQKGVDKRIDMLATILGQGGHIYDLQRIEHAYAPPYSSAKDPVNQLGFYAANILEGLVNPISCIDIAQRDDNTLLLDVRTQEEHEIAAIPESINIPVDQLREKIFELPKDKKIYIYCKAGVRGYTAARILMQNGFKEVYNLSGGYDLYKLFAQDQENAISESSQNNAPCDKHLPAEDRKVIDATCMQCPGPIIRLKEEVDKLNETENLVIRASDAGFYNDVRSWCNITGNTLEYVKKKDGGIIEASIRKCSKNINGDNKHTPSSLTESKTLVVFSDDLDRALATFVIANGALAMGKKVTLFFTFWGLNIIKKERKPRVRKDFMGRMFSKMMPASSKKLGLSKMHMAGLGSIMMRKHMKALHVDSLEHMIQQAIEGGAEIIACQMSMDVMGVVQEELIDGVQIGGVANYLEKADHSNHNLFI